MTMKLPPGPRGYPFIGVLPQFGRDPLGYLEKLRADYGDIVFAQLGGDPVFAVFTSELLEEVFLKLQKDLIKDPITRKTRWLLGDGLLVSEGETWRRHRKLAAPMLSKKRVEVYAQTIVDLTKECAAGLTPGIVDVHEHMMALTLRIVVRTLFGSDLAEHSQQAALALTKAMLAFEGEITGVRRVLPTWLPTYGRWQIRRNIQKLDGILYAMIEARKKSGAGGDDLLGLLLAAQDDAGANLAAREVRDEVATMFVAGHETTALALSYALALLARHPEAWARLVKEVEDVVGARDTTSSDLSRMPWLDGVVKESLRLYPPAWAIGREAPQGLSIQGYDLPPRGHFFIPIWAIHRDGRQFDEPTAFRPERWLDGLAERLPRYAYLPFGGGARSCIGNHFASMEAALVLATFSQRVRLPSQEPPALDLWPSITLRPRHGVRVVVEPVSRA